MTKSEFFGKVLGVAELVRYRAKGEKAQTSKVALMSLLVSALADEHLLARNDIHDPNRHPIVRAATIVVIKGQNNPMTFADQLVFEEAWDYYFEVTKLTRPIRGFYGGI